jgi:hypothetical protein
MSLRLKPRYAAAAVLALAGVMYAAQPWTQKDPAQWSAKEVERLLTNSAWAQEANAIFTTKAEDDPLAVSQLPGPAQAGMAGRNGVSDGHWDGGVGRNDRGGVPSLPVIVRWDSALPVRQALQRDPSRSAGFSSKEAGKDYIISVLGLIPAGRYQSTGQTETTSHSDDTVDAQNPEEMLEGLMESSRLIPQGGSPLTPEDAKLDASTGTIHLFFSRTKPIIAGDKAVVFVTRFGSLVIRKRFRLKDMIYKGKLEL